MQLNEISKALLGRYIKKANTNAMNMSHELGKIEPKSEKKDKPPEFDDKFAKAKKRKKFINKAVDKLANDNVEDEMASFVKLHFQKQKKPHFKMVNGKMTSENLNELDTKTLNKYITKSLEKRAQMYIDGKVNSQFMKTHWERVKLAQDKVDKKNAKELKKVFEEFPTNAMGSSSSVAGTGPIDTYDPLLATQRRKKKVMEIIAKRRKVQAL